MCKSIATLFLFAYMGTGTTARAELPGVYFRLLEAGVQQVEQRLSGTPSADLQMLEAGGHHSRHLFPHVILAVAVLYTKPDPSNHHHRDPKMLALGLKIGDLLASENQRSRLGR